jgi:hypothetical protein
MEQVHCMLDTYCYKHALRLYNNYCFSMATLVMWPHRNVTFICTLAILLVFHINMTWTVVMCIKEYVTYVTVTQSCTHGPCFTHFCHNTTCHYTLLYYLHPLFFSIMPFGWQHPITLTPVSSVISYMKLIFYLCHFLFTFTLLETQLGCKTRACCII